MKWLLARAIYNGTVFLPSEISIIQYQYRSWKDREAFSFYWALISKRSSVLTKHIRLEGAISWISTAKCCFPFNLKYKSENLNKIWKFENPRWRPPVTSFIWLLLPGKPIRHHVISLNWKYKWSLLYVPNFKPIGWIVSKVEGGPIDSPQGFV